MILTLIYENGVQVIKVIRLDKAMIHLPKFELHANDWSTNLLFKTNSKLFFEVGLKQPIYDKSHHNIMHKSLNLNISLPPYYYREI